MNTIVTPGTFRNHLSGEAAYKSFLPTSLQEVAEGKLPDGSRWHQGAEITAAVQSAEEKIAWFRGWWASLGAEEQEQQEEQLLLRETEASVLMAYPHGSAAPSFDFFSSWNRSGVPVGNHAEPGVVDANSGIFQRHRPSLEDVPEEFRTMAVEDRDNLYHSYKKAADLLERLPLSGRLLKDLHYIALYGEHYDKKYRGEFRRSPVWIGSDENSLRSAALIPPVEEEMTEAFSELEKFLHYEEDVNPLVKAALIHYQFETIHPFLDGNGRLGRMLTLLYLQESCGLPCAWIPLSEVLLPGLDRYYKEIRTVQLYGDYARWTQWFLRVLEEAVQLGSVRK